MFFGKYKRKIERLESEINGMQCDINYLKGLIDHHQKMFGNVTPFMGEVSTFMKEQVKIDEKNHRLIHRALEDIKTVCIALHGDETMQDVARSIYGKAE